MALYTVEDKSPDLTRVLGLMLQAMSENETRWREDIARATELYVKSGGQMTPETYAAMFPKLAKKLPFEQFSKSLETLANVTMEREKLSNDYVAATVEQIKANTQQTYAQVEEFKNESLRRKVAAYNEVVDKRIANIKDLANTYANAARAALEAGNNASYQEFAARLGAVEAMTRTLATLSSIVAAGAAAGNGKAVDAAAEAISQTDALIRVLSNPKLPDATNVEGLSKLLVARTIVETAREGYLSADVLKDLDISDEGKREVAKAAVFNLVKTRNSVDEAQRAKAFLMNLKVPEPEADQVVRSALEAAKGKQDTSGIGALVEALDRVYANMGKYLTARDMTTAANTLLSQAASIYSRIGDVSYKQIVPETGEIVDVSALPGGEAPKPPRVSGMSIPPFPSLLVPQQQQQQQKPMVQPPPLQPSHQQTFIPPSFLEIRPQQQQQQKPEEDFWLKYFGWGSIR